MQKKGEKLKKSKRNEKKRERKIERNSEIIGAALTGGRTSKSNEVVDVLQVLVRLAVASNQP